MTNMTLHIFDSFAARPTQATAEPKQAACVHTVVTTAALNKDMAQSQRDPWLKAAHTLYLSASL